MKHTSGVIASVILAALCIASAALPTRARASEDKAAVKLTKEENRVVVEVGGKPFTVYYYGPEGGRPYVRPFFFPVQAGDGAVVTSDQAQVEKGDHPHHRSLWVSHGDVNGADHWSLAKKADHVKERHVGFRRVEGDTIVQDLVWEGKEHEPMLKEARTIRFAADPDGSRTIDLTSEFAAVDKPVTFGDTKEAGLCAVRVAKSISDDPVLTLSTGATSARNADKAKKDPGDESNVWGKQADWCDISGKVDGKPYGLAILSHPSNPLPAKWHARRYGLVGANNVGASEFDKKNPKIYTPLTVEPGKPVTFRYRVIVHAGGAAEAKVGDKYKEYAK